MKKLFITLYIIIFCISSSLSWSAPDLNNIERLASWIIKNKDQKGTEDFKVVSEALVELLSENTSTGRLTVKIKFLSNKKTSKDFQKYSKNLLKLLGSKEKKIIEAIIFADVPDDDTWTFLFNDKEEEGIYYLDFERVRKNNENLLFWILYDKSKVSKMGFRSYIYYYQVNCKISKFKVLTTLLYKEKRGKGNFETVNSENSKWEFAPPYSSIENIIKEVCNHIK